MMFEFNLDRLAKVPPLKVCKECRAAIQTRREQLKFLVDEVAESGITTFVAQDFVQSVAADHDDMTVMTFAAFVVAAAQKRFRKPARSAFNFIESFMKVSYASLQRIESAIVSEVPAADCQWHRMGLGSPDEDDQGEDGPVPPDSNGPNMFG